MGDIVVIIGAILFFTFIGWCFYSAWYRPIEFESELKRVDKSIDDGHILWHLMMIAIVVMTVSGSVYSWYQF